ncbi:hypothetical protein FOA52_013786 [Chlamydomonas sp. UWO 241]|nr:hypothetical protein FOA52_013786 [Chlamydomonas sp. UWO 241]
MGIEFVEENKGPATVEFFVANTKTKPQHLEGEVVPELIHRIGDAKSQRLSIEMVERYLQRHVLLFDPKLLKEMFHEADYLSESSLSTRALAAAIGGRYPKRQKTADWRSLVSMLLGLPELVLTQDVVVPKVAKNGVFNAGNAWDDELPPLPGAKAATPTAKALSAEAADSADIADSSDAEKTSELPSSSEQQQQLQQQQQQAGARPSSEEATWVDHVLGVFTPYGPMPEGVPHPPAMPNTPSAFHTSARLAHAGGVGELTGTGAGAGTSTGSFGAAAPGAGTGTGSSGAAAAGAGASASATSTSAASAAGIDSSDPGWAWAIPPVPGLRAWSATLPPAGITLTAATLSTLRAGVTSTLVHKPGFKTTARVLGTSARDAKASLGDSRDLTQSLARVEPTRPLQSRFGASWLEACDYNTTCRTNPGVWHNSHPAAPAAAKAPHKYPWEWSV